MRHPPIGISLVLVTSVLVAIGQWRIHSRSEDGKIAICRSPNDVMGTDCRLIVVVPVQEQFRARERFKDAEETIRTLEASMSSWIETSEVSRIETASVDQPLTLSGEMLKVIDAARSAFHRTEGAFDVTCRPQLELWKQAERRGEPPSRAEIDAARAASNWTLVEQTALGIIKRDVAVSVDLGGIAKGYAIDRALESLRGKHVSGALVDIGGDLACFGCQGNGEAWLMSVRHPFEQEPLGKIRVTDCAVATSGNYARYREIAGRRYSHIIDPRTGMPTTAAESVTVTAPTAMVADMWATALSVLGPDGVSQLPAHVEALLVVGEREDYRILCTPGLAAMMEGQVPEGWTVVQR